MATARQIEANRRNAQRSTGPRTESGKARSRLNALKHGNRAVAVLPVLPHENPKALARRVQEWTEDLQPATAQQRDLIAEAARLSWALERAEKAEAARLSERVRQAEQKAAMRRIDRAEALGKDLFSGSECETGLLLRTPSGRTPAAILRRLESTAEGCRWLLDRWAEQQRLVRRRLPWTRDRLFRLVRLLGREATAAVWEPELSAVLLAVDVLKPGLAKDFWRACARSTAIAEDPFVSAEDWCELADRPASADGARDALYTLIGERVVHLHERLREHEAEAEAAADACVLAAAFDPGAEMGRLHRYRSACHRELVRTVELLRKLRKDPTPEPEIEPAPESEGLIPVEWAPPTVSAGAGAGGPSPPYEPQREYEEVPRIEPNEAAAEESETVLESEVMSSPTDAPGDERTRIVPAAAAPCAPPAARTVPEPSPAPDLSPHEPTTWGSGRPHPWKHEARASGSEASRSVVRVPREQDLARPAVPEQDDRRALPSVEVLEELQVPLDHLPGRLRGAVQLPDR
jgi:hypothetical protein